MKFAILVAFIALLAVPANAVRQITFAPISTTVGVGQILEIPVLIDTDGAPVGVVGFDIEYLTNIFEGLNPYTIGSVFPIDGINSPRRVERGIVGKQGFVGQGLIATLKFRGLQTGQAYIGLNNVEARFGPTGALVDGFQYNLPIQITVIESVPEPSSLLALGGGLIPIGLAYRKQKQ